MFYRRRHFPISIRKGIKHNGEEQGALGPDSHGPNLSSVTYRSVTLVELFSISLIQLCLYVKSVNNITFHRIFMRMKWVNIYKSLVAILPPWKHSMFELLLWALSTINNILFFTGFFFYFWVGSQVRWKRKVLLCCH